MLKTRRIRLICRCLWLATPVLVLLFAHAAMAQTVTVGSKKFTESVILGEIARHLLDLEGIEVRHRREMGANRVLWNALVAGDIDMYPDYTGTLLEETLAGEVETLDELPDALARHGMAVTETFGFDNAYAIGMRRDRAEALGIRTVSDLKRHPNLRFGFGNEFLDREDGWPGLQAAYELPQTFVRGMDHDLAYRGVGEGTIDVMDLYVTGAEIEFYDLVSLEDDLHYFTNYFGVYVYRLDLIERHAEIPDILGRLEGTIDEKKMIGLNARVLRDGIPETVVAAEFIEEVFQTDEPVVVQEETMWTRLVLHTKQHLVLVIVSLLAAILVSIPLGIIAAKMPRAGNVILGVVGAIYTIPSLALLVFMIPLMGIGGPPAMMALFLYSLLPIVRNTHAGILGITRPLLESAEALGLPPIAKLMRIELPLAARSILAGIQTSAILNVGTATLGALIGAGGYGQPILTGIRLADTGLILEGAVPAAALALVVQGCFTLSERVFLAKGLRLQSS